MTVVANTAMVAELFWIRGVNIDTREANDEEERNPDNVVIGEMTGLAYQIIQSELIQVLGTTYSRLQEYLAVTILITRTVFGVHLVQESIHYHFKG